MANTAKEYKIKFVVDEWASTLRTDFRKSMASKNYKPKTQAQLLAERKKMTAKGIGVASVSSKLTQEFFQVTGQNAKANRLKGATGIAQAMAGGFLAGGVVGALAGGGIALINQVKNFEKDRVEQNATANYLNEQSLTRSNNSRGDYYKFRA